MEESEKGSGWLVFASVLLMLVGVYNIIWGIAAVADSSVWVADTKLIFGSLRAWGWIYLIYGILQLCAGLGVLSKRQWARWTGVFIASLSAVLAFFFIWSYPIWAFTVILLDVLVIYGLAEYGGLGNE